MDHGLLDILTCPSCKSELKYRAKHQLLICTVDRLAFQIRQDKPIMLTNEAQQLSADQMAELLSNK